MYKKGLGLFFIIFFLCILIIPLLASGSNDQPNNQAEYVMVVQRGKPGRLIGTVIYENEKIIKIREDDGSEVTVEKDTILSMVKGVRYGSRVIARDPNNSRSIIGPTARPLGAGQGYLALTVVDLNPVVIAPNFSLGLGGIFTLSAGGIFYSGETANLFLNGKASLVRGPKRNLSLGAIFLTLPDEHYQGSFGTVYGMGTFGGQGASLNAGLGFGFSGEGISGRPMFIIGGELSASARVKLMIENWTNLQGFNLTSIGIRFFSKQFALDINFAIPWSSGGMSLWPFISPAYNFNLK
jgi:hypothetical protein